VEVTTSAPGAADNGGHRGPLACYPLWTWTKTKARIDWVQIDIGDDSHDHLIKAEARLTIAMARQ
jgi:arylsulfatase